MLGQPIENICEILPEMALKRLYTFAIYKHLSNFTIFDNILPFVTLILQTVKNGF